jgi:hypothetical protein
MAGATADVGLRRQSRLSLREARAESRAPSTTQRVRALEQDANGTSTAVGVLLDPNRIRRSKDHLQPRTHQN